jgi:hypothetical protein
MKFTLKKDVTLICVDGVNPDLSIKALRYSDREINFENVKLLSSADPSLDLKNIQYIKVPEMSWEGYNDFILNKLTDYIETPFCITVQTDGFILNPDLWRNEFFNYDYIGAPWPDDDNWIDLQWEKTRNSYRLNDKKSRVGNGGFSLRSKKFLEESSKYASCTGYGEDTFLCNINYKEMLAKGIKFPSVELASNFSIENPIKELGYSWPNSDDKFNGNCSFGFHGKYIKEYDHIIEKMKNYG